jgi:Carboxypeptidase regulatory-like domain
MRRSIPAFTISFTLLPWLLGVAPVPAQQTETDNFELSGAVINAATGEPVSRALVEMQAAKGRAQFAGADGTFVFKNLARGRYNLTASKPGFFSEQQLGRWNAGRNHFQDVPSEKDVVLKLTPEAIIYGEVKNESGEPVEGVTVRAQRWQTQNGRKTLQNARDAETDDEGNLRLAELTPGSYRLSFVPANRGGWIIYDKLNRKKQPDQGYGAQFYPGVADVESATAIELRAGAAVHITEALATGTAPGNASRFAKWRSAFISLFAKGDDWIDAGRAESGNVAGGEGHGEKYRRDGTEGYEVGRLDAVEHRA